METVEISVDEYKKLQEDHAFLACLRAAGVDSWEGYDLACEMFCEKEETV